MNNKGYSLRNTYKGTQPAYLLRVFTIFSIISLIAILFLVNLGIHRILIQKHINEAEHDATGISQAIFEHDRAILTSDLEGEVTLNIKPEDFPEVDKSMLHFLNPLNIVKIKVFSKDGEIIYSTDHTIIGQIDANNEKLNRALNGEIVSKLEKKEEVWDTTGEQRFDIDVVETYLPVRDENQKIIGSFEVYLDISRYQEGTKKALRLSMTVVAVVLVLVFGFLFIIMRRGTNELAENQETLKDSEERFRSVSETAKDAIISCDSQGKIIFWNPGAETIFGYSADEILDSPVILIMPERLRESHKKRFNLFIETGKAKIIGKTVEVFGLRKDGSAFPVEISLSTWKIKGNVYFTAIMRDITERKHIESELKKSRNKAEESSRIKSEFLANMSHEVRTPMNAIIGMSDLTLETELTPEQSEYLRVIKSSSESLLSLINDILDISKIEAGKFELEEIPFILREVVEGVAEALSIRAKDKGIEFLSYVDPGVPVLVIGDPTRLRQVLVNLVGNAIKFTEKGDVAIKVEIDSAKEETATGKRVDINFMVSDTGAGMSKADTERIFDKFSQADGSTTRKYGGTGLGLSISKSIVEMMGGHISVESEVGKGSVFHFSLNLECQDERRKEEREYVCPDFMGITVLIVDDNRTSRYILQKTLSAWGFHTSEAGNGKEALSLLQDDPDRFKLIILDHQMPDMDGMEVTRTVREDVRFQDIKIIILTSWGSVKTSLMKELNIAGAIFKPVLQSTLFNTLVKTFRTSIAVGERQVEGVVDTKAAQTDDSIKILLVEDNIDNQHLARTILLKAGFAVDIANNGQEAVEAFRRFRYDLILMDIQMPVMDGFTATAHIREIEKELGKGRVPIIALTAHAMKGYRKKCLEHDMDDYITKPLKRNVFLKTIDKWVDARPAILVVDDIDANRKLVENYLKKEGAYRTVFTKNGKEAVDVFKRQAVSLILMDMEMPVMDGYTAAGAIRELDRGREIPIIAMTAHKEAGEINKCMEAGCTDYLCKPIRKQTFIETIQRYLGRSKDLSRETVTSDKLAEETGQKDIAGKDIVVYVDPDLKDLIPEFFENINKDVKDIRRLLAEGRIEEIQRIGHSMKGSGSSYGFDGISEIGKGIEEAARDDNREEISCLNDRLTEYLSAVKVVPKEEG